MTDVLPKTQIERMEDALQAMMKEALDATFFVDIFPEDADKFDDAMHGRIALLQYRGSTYAPTDGTGAATQLRTASFVIHLIYNATAAGGSRPVKDIENLRLELQGQEILGGDIDLVRDGLIDQKAARRTYILELRLAVPVVVQHRQPLAPLMTDFSRESA
ncbi:hypothetical protein AN189_13085 [Loktanella sp. 3ANDIMAR09]|uniref:Gp37 family protein n=1 Tax=Loktanella sp. 3ANDIMAR09 TaxID=1225657 RepID=UPI0006FC06CA|nr:Gp37 family protein [Loktanella sp. 3ANDIMAR09]KQI67997.1 hypothetical protein AN189_13085 [Loktanella sp. 3ANDIMAR09]